MDDKRPIGVRIEDFQTNLENIINDSGLPAYILEMQIARVLPELQQIGKQQLEEERKQFQSQEVSADDND